MAEDDDAPETPKRGKGTVLIAGAIVLLFGGGGFAIGRSGLLPGFSAGAHPVTVAHGPAPAHGTFVEVDPLVISLPSDSGHNHLRIAVTLEVMPDAVHDVELLMPRIIDMLNTYLRAVEVADLEKTHILYQIRAHLRARMALIVGEGQVQDVLIREFVAG